MKNNKIIYIVVFILLIIIVWRYYKNTQVTTGNLSNVQSTFSSLVSTFTPHPVLTSTLPTSTSTDTGFKFGDLIYAKQNTTNAYKVPVASIANLDSYKAFNANDLIGTFLSYSGIFVKINATNPARIVYILSSQVYTK